MEHKEKKEEKYMKQKDKIREQLRSERDTLNST
jgi:hypothetical protein